MISYFRSKNTDALRDTGLFKMEDGFEAEVILPIGREMRTTAAVMAVSDATGGQAAVPTGFVNRIAARRNELRLADRLGVQLIPGVGTTVNHAYDNAAAAVFTTTSEQDDLLGNTYNTGRPTLATKAFTLVKYTRKIALTEETLDDEDANLMGFIADYIGREIALTHNSLLLTEVAANGTNLKTFASASAIAAGEPEVDRLQRYTWVLPGRWQ